MNIVTIGIITIGILIVMIVWGAAFIVKEKEKTKRILGRKMPVTKQEIEKTTPPTMLAENLHKVWKN